MFQTYSGIKQGASSPVILFITFMDEVIDILKEKCVDEPIINNLHCLLLADDTLVLSTDRNLFINKCNILIDAFHKKKMHINISKSGYMIVNASEKDVKMDLKLDFGWLSYKNHHKYLGVLICDTGKLIDDMNLFVKEKRKEVIVKLANFIYNNKFAPVMIKLKLVKSCVNASITYACECRVCSSVVLLEVLQRKALKIALSIRKNIPNEVLYAESGCIPLKAIIYKRQLKFYRKLKNDTISDPYSPITLIFNNAVNVNIQFIRHYKQLDEKFADERECYNFYVNQYQCTAIEKVRQKGTVDPDGYFGPYLQLNPNLKCPEIYQKLLCVESDRLIITRYRTGSHDLKIQAGRLTNTKRDLRLCRCGNNIQTLEHVLSNCPITANLRIIHGINNKNMKEIMNSNDYIRLASLLRSIENILTT